MMNSKFIVAMVLALCAGLISDRAMASGNIADGQKKAEPCKVCHGEGGNKPLQNDYPVLAGQHADYLDAVLRQYKSGKRKNEVMKAQVAGLSARDISDLAAYFAAQPSDLRKKY